MMGCNRVVLRWLRLADRYGLGVIQVEGVAALRAVAVFPPQI